MCQIEALLRRALELGDSSNQRERLKVYEAAQRAIVKSDNDAETESKNALALKTAIEKIEVEYAALIEKKAVIEEKFDAPHILSELQEDEKTVSGNSTSDVPKFNQADESQASKTLDNGSKGFKVFLWLLLAISLSAGVFFIYQNYFSERSNLRTNGKASGDTQILFQNNFNDPEKFFAGNVTGVSKIKLKRAIGSFIVEDNIRLYSKQMFRIDNKKLYTVEFEFDYKNKGTLKKDVPILRVGFVHFDGNKKLTKPPKSAHKYFTYQGRLEISKISKNDSNYIVSGIITGDAANEKDGFPTNAAFARLAISITKGAKPFSITPKRIKLEQLD